jgi:hypothetical protein
MRRSRTGPKVWSVRIEPDDDWALEGVARHSSLLLLKRFRINPASDWLSRPPSGPLPGVVRETVLVTPKPVNADAIATPSVFCESMSLFALAQRKQRNKDSRFKQSARDGN